MICEDRALTSFSTFEISMYDFISNVYGTFFLVAVMISYLFLGAGGVHRPFLGYASSCKSSVLTALHQRDKPTPLTILGHLRNLSATTWAIHDQVNESESSEDRRRN